MVWRRLETGTNSILDVLGGVWSPHASRVRSTKRCTRAGCRICALLGRCRCTFPSFSLIEFANIGPSGKSVCLGFTGKGFFTGSLSVCYWHAAVVRLIVPYFSTATLHQGEEDSWVLICSRDHFTFTFFHLSTSTKKFELPEALLPKKPNASGCEKVIVLRIL